MAGLLRPPCYALVVTKQQYCFIAFQTQANLKESCDN